MGAIMSASTGCGATTAFATLATASAATEGDAKTSTNVRTQHSTNVAMRTAVRTSWDHTPAHIYTGGELVRGYERM